MLTAALFLAMIASQAGDPPATSDEEPYIVEDPFDLTPEEAAEPAAARSAPAAQARPAASPERLICRSRPELGTRVRRLRVCMTAAEWQHHENNMEQQRRDISDWGAQGMATPR